VAMAEVVWPFQAEAARCANEASYEKFRLQKQLNQSAIAVEWMKKEQRPKMKTSRFGAYFFPVGTLCLFLLLAASASAQTYSINWYKIAGGGGTSSNGPYSLSGTIGQPDASTTMTGGNYSLTGGFWAFISVVQTPGAPTLYISVSGKTVSVYWQNVSGWTLQQNSSVTAPANWTPAGAPTAINGTNYVNFTSPTGHLFFRLANP
jgi:hypothetical protein